MARIAPVESLAISCSSFLAMGRVSDFTHLPWVLTLRMAEIAAYHSVFT